MSIEHISAGPMDSTREALAQATDLDDHLFLSANDPNYRAAVDHALADINERIPLIGQQNTIYGTPVTASIEVDEETGDMIVHEFSDPTVGDYKPVEHLAVTGLYEGVQAWQVYNPEFNRICDRLVHAVAHEQQHFYDTPHNSYLKTPHSYVLVPGSEIHPVLPVNAHSMADLEGDYVRECIDTVIDAHKEFSREGVIRAIAHLFEKILPDMETEDAELNRQRISYLNSRGLLAGMHALTDDFAVGEYDSIARNGDIEVSDLGQAFKFEPDMFEMRHGYERVGQGAEGGRPPELYVRFGMSFEQVIFAPTRAIKAYKTID